MSDTVSRAELFEPSQLLDSSTAVVMNNHLGGSVRLCSGLLGDTGREAQAIADHTGKLVIAHNRIGTGDDVTYSEQLVYDPNSDTGALVRQWADEVLPLVKDSGVTSVHLLGRSAGAAPLLAVAKQDMLPVSGICVIEPLGFTRMPTWEGRARFAAYKMLESCRPSLPNASNLRPPTGRLSRLAVDMAHNQAGWTSTDALNLAAMLGYDPRLRDIAVLMTFASSSLVGRAAELAPKLEALRASRLNPGTAPFEIRVVPGTTHRSFNGVNAVIAQYEDLAKLAGS